MTVQQQPEAVTPNSYPCEFRRKIPICENYVRDVADATQPYPSASACLRLTSCAIPQITTATPTTMTIHTHREVAPPPPPLDPELWNPVLW